MKTHSYHIYSTKYGTGLFHGNVKDESRPLIVNCAGSYSMDSGFNTDNPTGRVDYYLLYIVEGTMRMVFPDGMRECGAGTFFVIPPNTPYKYFTDKDVKFSYLWIHFTGSEAKEKYEKHSIKTFPEVNKISPDGKIIARFNSIFEAFSSNDKFSASELSLMLERLFITLGRRLTTGNSRPLKVSLGHIGANYNTDIRVPELARLEGLSVSRYNTVFRESLGISPVEYITNLRISAACELLNATDASIKEIAISVGYTDPHFFSKTFKKKTGLSPSEYRKDPDGYEEKDILSDKY